MRRGEWATALIIVGLSIIVGALMFAPEPLPPTVITEVDTVETIVVEYIPQDPIVIEHIVEVKDTVYITVGGDSIDTEYASLDTAFEDSARLSIDYFITPRVFSVEYMPAPIKVKEIIITKDQTVYVDTSAWWDRFDYGAYTGIATSAILVYLLK